MTSNRPRAGRGVSRPALMVLGLAAVTGLALAAARAGARGTTGQPISVPNPEATAPVESVVGSLRYITRTGAPELLLPDSSFPHEPVRLLWLEGRGASPLADGRAVVLDGSGGAVRFDDRLRPSRLRLRLEGREPASIAGAEEGFWIVDGGGTVVRVDREGRVRTAVPGPFDYATVAASEQGRAWLVRSAEQFAFRVPTADLPLLVAVGEGGEQAERIGSVRVPEHVLLAELAGAGHIAIDTDRIYYAPFIRDEVIAFSPSGDTLWVARRGLPQSTEDPRFEIGPEGPTIDYAPVNLGVAVGLNGLVYVLSVPGYTTSASRLDVFHPDSGTLLRTAHLDTPLPTLAVGKDGRLYALDPFRLLTGIAPRERAAFAPFELEHIGGGRMASDDLRGRVVLVNFWASWCAPCRHELPALDTLQQSIADPDFAFITMNEDVNVMNAADFLEEHRFDFPVLLGKGNLRTRYHYIGLPFTVLLDREGRVVQRWIGYAGEEQLSDIRSIIRSELERGREALRTHEEHGTMHGDHRM